MPPRRSLALLAVLAALVVSLLGLTGSPGQAAPTAAPANSAASVPAAQQVVAKRASTAYYSDPVFYPVRQPMRMDCYKKNPGCTTHKAFQLDLVSVSGPCEKSPVKCPAGPDGNRVYAMGAGIVDQVTYKPTCGGSKTTFGNQINISHGGGVSSRYGHLADINVKVGQQVAAGELIGTMGRTGAQKCEAHAPYLDFYVDHGPKQIDFKTLVACVGGSSQSWPGDQFPKYPVWNDVPRFNNRTARTEFPNPADHPNDTPDTSCLPTAQVTRTAPGAPSTANAGSGTIKVTLPAITDPAVDHLVLETQYYSPAFGKWIPVSHTYGVSPSTKSVKVGGLKDGTTARVRVAAHSGGPSHSSGWSEYGGWTTIDVGLPPLKPKYRSLKTNYIRSAKKSVIAFGWKSGKQRGFPPLKYIVEIRKGKTGSWKVTKLPRTTYGYRFEGLKPKKAYTVRVKSRSAVGDSAYLVRTITTAKATARKQP